MPLLRKKVRSFFPFLSTSQSADSSASRLELAPASPCASASALVAVKKEEKEVENDNQKDHCPTILVTRRGSAISSNCKIRRRARMRTNNDSSNSPTSRSNSSSNNNDYSDNNHSDSELKKELLPSKSQSQRRQVHFSDSKGLVLCHEDVGATYYPTPTRARPFVSKGSLRQLTTEEMELYFCDDDNTTLFPSISSQDYAVKRLEQKKNVFLCGCIQILHENLIILKWKPFWIELYHGILILSKYQPTCDSKVNPSSSKQRHHRRRLVLPISKCQMDIIQFLHVYELELKCCFESKQYTKRFRFQTRKEMFVWWLAIQIASKSKFDPLSLQQQSISTLHINKLNIKRIQQQQQQQQQHQQQEQQEQVTHLILVRHGEAENMHFCVKDQEKKLTLKGRQQAKATANFLQQFLQEKLIKKKQNKIRLVYSQRCRSFETAKIFLQQIDLITHTNECMLLNDGAPKAIERSYREEYREGMHQLAFEFLCRFDPSDKIKTHHHDYSSPVVPMQHTQMDTYTIVICHGSFIQYCLTQAFGSDKQEFSKILIEYGAPISHCSLTQIDIDEKNKCTPIYSNRTNHLPLPFRSTD
jgi:broad specificity phosphatase PhoE